MQIFLNVLNILVHTFNSTSVRLSTCSVCFLHKQLCSFLCKISGLEKFRNLELSNSSYTLFGLNPGLLDHNPPPPHILAINPISTGGGGQIMPPTLILAPYPGFSNFPTVLQPKQLAHRHTVSVVL